MSFTMYQLASPVGQETTTTTVIEATFDVAGVLSKDFVAQINSLCDQAEDAGVGCILRINLEGRLPDEVRHDDAPHLIDVNLVNHWERALRRLERVPGVTVAVLTGDVGGLGLALLLCTDYRIIGETTLLRLSHPGQPQLPGMVLHRLSNQLGVVLSRRMALLDRHLSAQEALRHGFVDDVCNQPGVAAASLMQDLHRQDLTHASMQRRLILEAPAVSYEDALGSHLAACDRVLRQAQVAKVTAAATAP